MHIPGDPLKRFWVEAADANPHLVDKFRSVVVGFLAFDRAHEAKFAGSGFVIWGNQEFALVLTAKHVLQEGVLRIQKPESVRASLNAFSLAQFITPSVDPNHLRLVWAASQHQTVLNVVYGEYTDQFDIGLCLGVVQEGSPSPFEPASVPVNTSVPDVGSVVHMVSLLGLASTELSPPVDRSGTGQRLLFDWRVSIRIGTVTGVYPNGLRQYRWPCFTTSIPAEPGMSGGFVYVPQDGGTIGACGIVCADCSSDIARMNQYECGESVIACAWPALALRSPVGELSPTERTLRSLYDMALLGELDMPIGGIEHIHFDGARIVMRKI